MTDPGSVSRCIQSLREGDSKALPDLWKRYYTSLLREARRRLGTRSRARMIDDEEDVVSHVFNAFYTALKSGRYPDVTNRDSLWRLLLTIAINKVRDVQRRPRRQRRGAGRELGESALAGRTDFDSDQGIATVIGRDPTPDFALSVAESLQERFEQLGDPRLRTIATMKMQGFENREIADQLVCSTRSIERKLALIRKIWLTGELTRARTDRNA